MIVYRLSKSKHAGDLSGKGAEMAGGRWNRKGTAMLYTSQTRALCTAEMAVHTPLGIMPEDYALIIIEIPEDSMMIISYPDLPDEWKSFPHSGLTRQIGDHFVKKNEFLVLKVPSAVVQGEYNFLINTKHPGISRVKILQVEPFEFDRRLFRS
ncbi:MAG: RES family NAD+ phosphorylase [Bacteroidales bacterium]|nr:RES family NAD+ phosphorylase [Bacteroidales bacterium]